MFSYLDTGQHPESTSVEINGTLYESILVTIPFNALRYTNILTLMDPSTFVQVRVTGNASGLYPQASSITSALGISAVYLVDIMGGASSFGTNAYSGTAGASENVQYVLDSTGTIASTNTTMHIIQSPITINVLQWTESAMGIAYSDFIYIDKVMIWFGSNLVTDTCTSKFLLDTMCLVGVRADGTAHLIGMPIASDFGILQSYTFQILDAPETYQSLRLVYTGSPFFTGVYFELAKPFSVNKDTLAISSDLGTVYDQTATIPRTGLVFYSPFDGSLATQPTGTTAVAKNGAGNQVTASYADGVIGKALVLDGSKYIATNVADRASSISISAYVYALNLATSSAAPTPVFDARFVNGSSIYGTALGISTQGITIDYNNGEIVHDYAFTESTWYYIVVTINVAANVATITSYVNNILVQQSSNISFVTSATKFGTFDIGYSKVSGSMFTGYIDEVVLYNRVLTLNDVKALGRSSTLYKVHVGESCFIAGSLGNNEHRGMITVLSYTSIPSSFKLSRMTQQGTWTPPDVAVPSSAANTGDIIGSIDNSSVPVASTWIGQTFKVMRTQIDAIRLNVPAGAGTGGSTPSSITLALYHLGQTDILPVTTATPVKTVTVAYSTLATGGLATSGWVNVPVGYSTAVPGDYYAFTLKPDYGQITLGIATGNVYTDGSAFQYNASSGAFTWMPSASLRFQVVTSCCFDPMTTGILQIKDTSGTYQNWRVFPIAADGTFVCGFDTNATDTYLTPGVYDAKIVYDPSLFGIAGGNPRYTNAEFGFTLVVGDIRTKLEYQIQYPDYERIDDIAAREYPTTSFTDQKGEPYTTFVANRTYGDPVDFKFKLTALDRPMTGAWVWLQIGVIPTSLAWNDEYGGSTDLGYLLDQYPTQQVFDQLGTIAGFEQKAFEKPVYYPYFYGSTVKYWTANVWVAVQTDQAGIADFTFPNGIPIKNILDMIQGSESIGIDIYGNANTISDVNLFMRAVYAGQFTWKGMDLSNDPKAALLHPAFSESGNKQWQPSSGNADGVFDLLHDNSYAMGRLHVERESVVLVGGSREVDAQQMFETHDVGTTSFNGFPVTMTVSEANQTSSGLVPIQRTGMNSNFHDPNYPVTVAFDLYNLAGTKVIISSEFLRASTTDPNFSSNDDSVTIYVDPQYAGLPFISPGTYEGKANTTATVYLKAAPEHDIWLTILPPEAFNLSQPASQFDFIQALKGYSFPVRGSQLQDYIMSLNNGSTSSGLGSPAWETGYPMVIGQVAIRNTTRIYAPDYSQIGALYSDYLAAFYDSTTGNYSTTPLQTPSSELVQAIGLDNLEQGPFTSQDDFDQLYRSLHPDTDGALVSIKVNDDVAKQIALTLPDNATQWQQFMIPLDNYGDWRMITNNDGTKQWIGGVSYIDTNNDGVPDTWVANPLNVSIEVQSAANYTNKEILLSDFKVIDSYARADASIWDLTSELPVYSTTGMPVLSGYYDGNTGQNGSFSSVNPLGENKTFEGYELNVSREGPSVNDVYRGNFTAPTWSAFTDQFGNSVIANGEPIYGTWTNATDATWGAYVGYPLDSNPVVASRVPAHAGTGANMTFPWHVVYDCIHVVHDDLFYTGNDKTTTGYNTTISITDLFHDTSTGDPAGVFACTYQPATGEIVHEGWQLPGSLEREGIRHAEVTVGPTTYDAIYMRPYTSLTPPEATCLVYPNTYLAYRSTINFGLYVPTIASGASVTAEIIVEDALNASQQAVFKQVLSSTDAGKVNNFSFSPLVTMPSLEDRNVHIIFRVNATCPARVYWVQPSMQSWEDIMQISTSLPPATNLGARLYSNYFMALYCNDVNKNMMYNSLGPGLPYTTSVADEPALPDMKFTITNDPSTQSFTSLVNIQDFSPPNDVFDDPKTLTWDSIKTVFHEGTGGNSQTTYDFPPSKEQLYLRLKLVDSVQGITQPTITSGYFQVYDLNYDGLGGVIPVPMPEYTRKLTYVIMPEQYIQYSNYDEITPATSGTTGSLSSPLFGSSSVVVNDVAKGPISNHLVDTMLVQYRKPASSKDIIIKDWHNTYDTSLLASNPTAARQQKANAMAATQGRNPQWPVTYPFYPSDPADVIDYGTDILDRVDESFFEQECTGLSWTADSPSSYYAGIDNVYRTSNMLFLPKAPVSNLDTTNRHWLATGATLYQVIDNAPSSIQGINVYTAPVSYSSDASSITVTAYKNKMELLPTQNSTGWNTTAIVPDLGAVIKSQNFTKDQWLSGSLPFTASAFASDSGSQEKGVITITLNTGSWPTCYTGGYFYDTFVFETTDGNLYAVWLCPQPESLIAGTAPTWFANNQYMTKPPYMTSSDQSLSPDNPQLTANQLAALQSIPDDHWIKVLFPAPFTTDDSLSTSNVATLIDNALISSKVIDKIHVQLLNNKLIITQQQNGNCVSKIGGAFAICAQASRDAEFSSSVTSSPYDSTGSSLFYVQVVKDGTHLVGKGDGQVDANDGYYGYTLAFTPIGGSINASVSSGGSFTHGYAFVAQKSAGNPFYDGNGNFLASTYQNAYGNGTDLNMKIGSSHEASMHASFTVDPSFMQLVNPSIVTTGGKIAWSQYKVFGYSMTFSNASMVDSVTMKLISGGVSLYTFVYKVNNDSTIAPAYDITIPDGATVSVDITITWKNADWLTVDSSAVLLQGVFFEHHDDVAHVNIAMQDGTTYSHLLPINPFGQPNAWNEIAWRGLLNDASDSNSIASSDISFSGHVKQISIDANSAIDLKQVQVQTFNISTGDLVETKYSHDFDVQTRQLHEMAYQCGQAGVGPLDDSWTSTTNAQLSHLRDPQILFVSIDKDRSGKFSEMVKYVNTNGDPAYEMTFQYTGTSTPAVGQSIKDTTSGACGTVLAVFSNSTGSYASVSLCSCTNYASGDTIISKYWSIDLFSLSLKDWSSTIASNPALVPLGDAMNVSTYHDTNMDGIFEYCTMHVQTNDLRTDDLGETMVASKQIEDRVLIDTNGDGSFDLSLSQVTTYTSNAISIYQAMGLDYLTGQWVSHQWNYSNVVYGHIEAASTQQNGVFDTVRESYDAWNDKPVIPGINGAPINATGQDASQDYARTYETHITTIDTYTWDPVLGVQSCNRTTIMTNDLEKTLTFTLIGTEDRVITARVIPIVDTPVIKDPRADVPDEVRVDPHGTLYWCDDGKGNFNYAFVFTKDSYKHCDANGNSAPQAIGVVFDANGNHRVDTGREYCNCTPGNPAGDFFFPTYWLSPDSRYDLIQSAYDAAWADYLSGNSHDQFFYYEQAVSIGVTVGVILTTTLVGAEVGGGWGALAGLIVGTAAAIALNYATKTIFEQLHEYYDKHPVKATNQIRQDVQSQGDYPYSYRKTTAIGSTLPLDGDLVTINDPFALDFESPVLQTYQNNQYIMNDQTFINAIHDEFRNNGTHHDELVPMISDTAYFKIIDIFNPGAKAAYRQGDSIKIGVAVKNTGTDARSVQVWLQPSCAPDKPFGAQSSSNIDPGCVQIIYITGTVQGQDEVIYFSTDGNHAYWNDTTAIYRAERLASIVTNGRLDHVIPMIDGNAKAGWELVPSSYTQTDFYRQTDLSIPLASNAGGTTGANDVSYYIDGQVMAYESTYTDAYAYAATGSSLLGITSGGDWRIWLSNQGLNLAQTVVALTITHCISSSINYGETEALNYNEELGTETETNIIDAKSLETSWGERFDPWAGGLIKGTAGDWIMDALKGTLGAYVNQIWQQQLVSEVLKKLGLMPELADLIGQVAFQVVGTVHRMYIQGKVQAQMEAAQAEAEKQQAALDIYYQTRQAAAQAMRDEMAWSEWGSGKVASDQTDLENPDAREAVAVADTAQDISKFSANTQLVYDMAHAMMKWVNVIQAKGFDAFLKLTATIVPKQFKMTQFAGLDVSNEQMLSLVKVSLIDALGDMVKSGQGETLVEDAMGSVWFKDAFGVPDENFIGMEFDMKDGTHVTWDDIVNKESQWTVKMLSDALKDCTNLFLYDPTKTGSAPKNLKLRITPDNDVDTPAVNTIRGKVEDIIQHPSKYVNTLYANSIDYKKDANTIKDNWEFFKMRFYDLINMVADSSDPDVAYNLFVKLNRLASTVPGMPEQTRVDLALFKGVKEETFSAWVEKAWLDMGINDPRANELMQKDGVLLPASNLMSPGIDGADHATAGSTMGQALADDWTANSQTEAGYSHQQESYTQKLIMDLQISDMITYLIAKKTEMGNELANLLEQMKLPQTISGTGYAFAQPSSGGVWSTDTKLFVESLLSEQTRTSDVAAGADPAETISLAAATNAFYTAITRDMNKMFESGKEVDKLNQAINDFIMKRFANGMWQANDIFNLAEGTGLVVQADGQQKTFAPKPANGDVLVAANSRIIKIVGKSGNPGYYNPDASVYLIHEEPVIDNAGNPVLDSQGKPLTRRFISLVGIADAKRCDVTGVVVNRQTGQVFNGIKYILDVLNKYPNDAMAYPEFYRISIDTTATDAASSEIVLAKTLEASTTIDYQSGATGIKTGVIAAHREGTTIGQSEAVSGIVDSAYRAMIPYAKDMNGEILGTFQQIRSLVGTASSDSQTITWTDKFGQPVEKQFSPSDVKRSTWDTVTPQDVMNWLSDNGAFGIKGNGHQVTDLDKGTTKWVSGTSPETSPDAFTTKDGKYCVNDVWLDQQGQMVALDTTKDALGNKQQRLVDLSSWSALDNMMAGDNVANLQFAKVENRLLEIWLPGEQVPPDSFGASESYVKDLAGGTFASNYGKFAAAMANINLESSKTDFTYQNAGFYPTVRDVLLGNAPVRSGVSIQRYVPEGWEIKMAYDEYGHIACNGQEYKFMIQNIENPARYFTVTFDFVTLSFIITVPDEMAGDSLLGSNLGTHSYSAYESAYEANSQDIRGKGYDMALEHLGEAIEQMLSPATTEALSPRAILVGEEAVDVQACAFFSELALANGQGLDPARIKITKFEKTNPADPNSAANIEFQTLPGVLPGDQIWYFKTTASVTGGEPTTLSIKNLGDANWMEIPFSDLAPDAWFDQIIRPVERVEMTTRAIGLRDDTGVHQPGRLASDIVPVVSLVTDDGVHYFPSVSFIISMDSANGGTLEYQCQMALIDSSGRNGVTVSYNGYLISSHDGYIPNTFTDYFMKMSELHEQISAEAVLGAEFIAGAPNDPHLGCTITLPIWNSAESTKTFVSFSGDFGVYSQWVGLHIKEIADERPEFGTQTIQGDFWSVPQISDLNAILVNRETLIEDTGSYRDKNGDPLHVQLSYQRHSTDDYWIDYSVSYEIMVVANGWQTVPINLKGHMAAISGEIFVDEKTGSYTTTASIGDRFSSVLGMVDNLQVFNPHHPLLLQIPGEDLVSFGLRTHVLYMYYTKYSDVPSTYSDRFVYENIGRNLRDGHLVLLGFTIPAENPADWKELSFPNGRGIDLGDYPNVRPTIDYILASLACDEIKINTDIFGVKNIADKVFKISLTAGDNSIVIQVFYDPTSTSTDPAITNILYTIGTSTQVTYHKYMLETEAGVQVQYQGTDGVMHSIYFADWLYANKIEYASLSWKSAYADFILFLRGQVTKDWDPLRLPET